MPEKLFVTLAEETEQSRPRRSEASVGRSKKPPGETEGLKAGFALRRSEQTADMSNGSARYLRYILFAFFGLVLIYFISSSSIPQKQIPAAETALDWAKSKSSQAASAALPQASSVFDTMTPITSGGLPPVVADGERMNATFVTLARNTDLWEIVKSIRHVEDRFNRKFNYDWVFLNDNPFEDEFKKVTSALISGKTHYGVIPADHWSFPDFIDQDKAAKVREDMREKKIIYGDSISYRHMCRYESGFFFRHPLMNQFEWYWRVEPSIELFCDINYDTFKYMRDHGKKYSFVVSLYEYVETIPTLWDSAKAFMKAHPEHIADGNSMGFLSDDGGKTYNHCHFWSNFEIGNLNWLRSEAYLDFFNSLDRDGGFFYERWGDAPVHSIAAGLMLKKEEIHFFNDIGYYHVPFTHCPTGQQYKLDHKCHCNPKDNFDWKGYSCTNRYFDINELEKPEGYQDEQ
ncbi:MAG: Nucleotide-diphospho-sugar transferase [Lasallia pustulata]|uniref:Nucleotide-diphospho-sugar transferase n=1 Tax=Lasallia pustulata TaxID=136370 RepID=A0A5M8PFP0_9LECA|nr:MAG: Nucleotide-diphospho-sugar transferase [Lasallia pustulata]